MTASKDEDIQKLRDTLHEEQRMNEKLTEDLSMSQRDIAKTEEVSKEYERQVEMMEREKGLLQTR